MAAVYRAKTIAAGRCFQPWTGSVLPGAVASDGSLFAKLPGLHSQNSLERLCPFPHSPVGRRLHICVRGGLRQIRAIPTPLLPFSSSDSRSISCQIPLLFP